MLKLKNALMAAAAGFVMTTGAFAADAPKAAPAPALPPLDFVKLCTAYGTQFYFVPGTDTCLRIGGYVRAEYYANYNAGGGEILSWTRATPLTATRARAVIDLDARQNTEYGTLRSYARMGLQNTSISGLSSVAGNNAVYFERAFIQLGGLTAGYLQSFYDYFTGFAMATPNGGSNRWTTVLAYTAKMDGGLSATLSLEDSANRRTSIRDLGLLGVINTGTPVNGYAGQAMPDVVANVRLEKEWGSAQLSGALHQVRPAFFAPALGTFVEPDSAYGWAVQAGVTLNVPSLGAGDTFVLQAAYSDGAVDYVAGFNTSPISPASLISVSRGGNVYGNGLASNVFAIPVLDAYTAFGDLETTKAWNVTAAYRHFWTPTLRTAIWGTYTSVDAPGLALWATGPARSQIGVGADFTYWQVGTNTVWSPVRNLDIGVELLYVKVDPQGGKDYDTFGGMLRFQRNF